MAGHVPPPAGNLALASTLPYLKENLSFDNSLAEALLLPLKLSAFAVILSVQPETLAFSNLFV